jgi:hypothetical protein
MIYQDKTYEGLIKASNEASSRSRLIFMTLNFAGLILIIVQATSIFSWIGNKQTINERFDHSYQDSLKSLATKLSHEDSIAYLSKLVNFREEAKALSEVLDKELGIVTMPIVGLKFSVYDIGIVSVLTMFILVFWYFYCVRRENHILQQIIKECEYLVKSKLQNTFVFKYLYHSIVHHYVFLTVTPHDTATGKERKLLRSLNHRLSYVPFYVSSFMFLTDIFSLFLETKYTDFPSQSRILIGALTPWEISVVIFRLVLCLLATIYFYYLCRDISRIEDSSTKLLQELEGFTFNPIY